MQGHYFAYKGLLFSTASQTNSLAHPQTFVIITLALRVLCWRLVFRPNGCMHDVSLNSSVYVTCRLPPPNPCGVKLIVMGIFPVSCFFLCGPYIRSVFCSVPYTRRVQAPRLEFCNRNVYISYMTPDCWGIDYGFVIHIFPFCLVMIT
jgi:hypothetical protein